MSEDGRWKWYRLWMKNSQLLNFFREDKGSALDQPYLLEWMRQSEFSKCKNFAAVLGDPVVHSRSPAEHFDFFKKQNKPFFAIKIESQDFDSAFPGLQKLGLSEAAVTSPLKDLAFQKSQACNLSALEIASTNTLILKNNKDWLGTNTDIDGIRAISKNISHLDASQIGVWGGGGTLKVIKKVYPQALYFSSRHGTLRDASNSTAIFSPPRFLIWAVGRKNFDRGGVFPPSDWPLEMIIDLNYAEDSPGRECAQQFSCSYISGLAMFKAQAQAQKNFWREFS